MQLLDRQTVSAHLTMPMAIDAIEQLLISQSRHPDWVKCPERLVIPTFSIEDQAIEPIHAKGSHLSMPSVVFDGEQEFSVVKLVTICPDNPSRDLPTTTAIITVSDNATGQILAIMDGIYVTQVRTAALSGIATKHLADPDSQCVAVIGCGGMAYEQLNAVLTVCPHIRRVTLWNRSSDKATTFKANFERDYPQWSVALEVHDAMASALKDADIVNLATRATTGLFDASAIKSRVHINAVGAYQPTMKEVSDEVIAACSHVIIDDKTGGYHEAGDLIQADAAQDCPWTWDDLTGDLQQLITQSGELALKDKGMTLFKSVGAASFDAAVALELAKLAQERNLGSSVSW